LMLESFAKIGRHGASNKRRKREIEAREKAKGGQKLHAKKTEGTILQWQRKGDQKEM